MRALVSFNRKAMVELVVSWRSQIASESKKHQSPTYGVAASRRYLCSTTCGDAAHAPARCRGQWNWKLDRHFAYELGSTRSSTACALYENLTSMMTLHSNTHTPFNIFLFLVMTITTFTTLCLSIITLYGTDDNLNRWMNVFMQQHLIGDSLLDHYLLYNMDKCL